MRHAALFAFSLVLVAAGCGGGSSGTDAGSTPTDAGTDAATVLVDAGADGGGSGSDAGSDAASTPTDAGTDAFAASDANDVDAFFSCDPHTFVVTSDGVSYSIDGVAGNPTLHLCAGVTYMFDLSTVSTFHPLGLYATGTVAPVAMFPGMATTGYTAPTSGPIPDTYRCTIHGFGGAVVVR